MCEKREPSSIIAARLSFSIACPVMVILCFTALSTKTERFLVFFVSFFKVEFKRYHFLKTAFGEDLNYRPRLSGADFAEYFAKSAPFFVSEFVKCLCLGGCA